MKKRKAKKKSAASTFAQAKRLAESLGLRKLVVHLPRKKNGSMKVYGSK